jgi:hypothetical protein
LPQNQHQARAPLFATFSLQRWPSTDLFEQAARDQPPAVLFNPGNLMFSGGGGTYLQFKKEGYTYTVFSAVGKWGKNCFTPQEEPQTCLRDIDGVAVQKDGIEVANIPCKQDADYVPGQFAPEFWDKIGLGEGSSQQEFDIPQAFFKNEFREDASHRQAIGRHREKAALG